MNNPCSKLKKISSIHYLTVYLLLLVASGCHRRDLYQIPVSEYSSRNTPHIEIIVAEKPVTVLFDSGANCKLKLAPSILSGIEEKSYIGIRKTYGIKGKEYKYNLYQIPEVHIAGCLFKEPYVQELNYEQIQDARFPRCSLEAAMERKGTVGWKLFQNTNLLLDFANSRIILCDQFEDVKRVGCFMPDFIHAELVMNNDYIGGNFDTPFGPRRLAIDSGSTINILSSKGMDAEYDQFQDYVLPYFIFGGKNLGSIEFRPFSFPEIFPADGILGMEFLMQHIVYIDFIHQRLSIAPVK